jgi:hypothetical protein
MCVPTPFKHNSIFLARPQERNDYGNVVKGDKSLFGESFATKEPFTSFLRQTRDKLYIYPVCLGKRGHQSPLIQVLGFSPAEQKIFFP